MNIWARSKSNRQFLFLLSPHALVFSFSDFFPNPPPPPLLVPPPVLVSYPVFTPKPGTHRMHDPRSIVPHIWPKGFTDNQMS
jgi:hypothetical protein